MDESLLFLLFFRECAIALTHKTPIISFSLSLSLSLSLFFFLSSLSLHFISSLVSHLASLTPRMQVDRVPAQWPRGNC